MNVKMITLGCKVNQYESQSMLAALVKAGFSAATAEITPDIIVVNSCTVTATSDQKVRQTVNRARKKNPFAVIVLTGCMPQAFPDEASRYEKADIILGNANRSILPTHILNYLSTKQRIVDILPHLDNEPFEAMAIDKFAERTRAFVKIEDGCNRFCSYCIIPYARGRVRSKPLADLVREVTALVENGYSEVVLTGINLSAYGKEINLGLVDAVSAVCDVPKLKRVRLSSLEPESLDRETTQKLASFSKLCPQFHLSLQSGSDRTLERMNRHYTTNDYRQIVRNLREAFDNTAITTDIMVGFPGETETDFETSISFAKEIGFAKTHVFAYSRRPGTRANDFPNQIQNSVKTLRSREMIAVTTETQKAFFKTQIGRTEEVLFEQQRSEGLYVGYTKNYTPVTVHCEFDICASILPVSITSANESCCIGEIIQN